MRYFYDTEFIENGSTIDLVSIGIVAEDGREYYAVSTDADHTKANKWVREHVLDKLPNPSSPLWRSREQIRTEVYEFLTASPGRPELWAWIGAYDHVVFAQLWGDMSSLPSDMPRYTQSRGNHDALVDARHNLRRFRICHQVLPLRKDNKIR